mmetsp:Transcript_25011/g.78333  ORF Transcript_25011/g.78333 Transcript_25011/m.78333 type:complete len:295 (-) Transcript_25011:571-1455(-)
MMCSRWRKSWSWRSFMVRSSVSVCCTFWILNCKRLMSWRRAPSCRDESLLRSAMAAQVLQLRASSSTHCSNKFCFFCSSSSKERHVSSAVVEASMPDGLRSCASTVIFTSSYWPCVSESRARCVCATSRRAPTWAASSSWFGMASAAAEGSSPGPSTSSSTPRACESSTVTSSRALFSRSPILLCPLVHCSSHCISLSTGTQSARLRKFTSGRGSAACSGTASSPERAGGKRRSSSSCFTRCFPSASSTLRNSSRSGLAWSRRFSTAACAARCCTCSSPNTDTPVLSRASAARP